MPSDIYKEYKQQYIAYKVETNFVNIKISKNELQGNISLYYKAYML
jgi:predicted transport protein